MLKIGKLFHLLSSPFHYGVEVGMSPELLAPLPVSELTSVLPDVSLEGESKGYLVSLYERVRVYVGKETMSNYASRMPSVLRSVVFVSSFVMVYLDATSVVLKDHVNGGWIRHTNETGNLVLLDSAVWSFGTRDSDASFTIEKSGKIFVTEHLTSDKVVDGMQVNSGNTQTGQPRAKQAERPGVCNEHVPAPKGKMCSEPHGNMGTTAEMIVGHAGHILPHVLTDCNTEFVFAYVDPNRFFKTTDWMPTLNQDGKVLRIHLRMNYVCTNRMLQGVIQGWT